MTLRIHYRRISARTKVLAAAAFFAFFASYASIICVWSTTPVNAQKQLVYSISQKQTLSERLNVIGNPVYIMLPDGNKRGLFIARINGTGVGSSIGLIPGDVLLSINTRVVTEARDADKILSDLGQGKVKAVFARVSGGQAQIYSPTVNYLTSTNATVTPSAYGDASHSTFKSAGPATQKAASMDQLEQYMFQLINSDRKQNGNLPPLRYSNELAKLARAYAEDMARRGFFNHVDPEGRLPRDRARNMGLKLIVWENLAWQSGYYTETELVARCQADMMNEPPNVPDNHRGCILNKDHIMVGVGIARLPKGGVVTVQEFSPGEWSTMWQNRSGSK